MLRKLLPILIAANCVAPVAAADRNATEMVIEPSEKQLRQIRALTPEGVASGVKVKDDVLEAAVTLTTYDAYRSKGAFTDTVRSDNFLQAAIDKRTGEVRYKLRQDVAYNWKPRDFTWVNFVGQDGLQKVELERLLSEEVVCFPGLCSFREEVAFSISEAQLRLVASQYVPGTATFWRLRFKARSGTDWDDRISAAEVAGLLLAVDRYRAAHNRSAAQ